MNKISPQFNIQIIDENVQLLLSLADTDRLGSFYNNLTDQLVHNKARKNTQAERFYGHPFIHWDVLQQRFFTTTEIKHLHKRFRHSYTDKLLNFLKHSELKNISADTRAMPEHITRRCKPCQTYAQTQWRFKFALREERGFNRTVLVDIFYIDSKQILHVVVESTRYQAARCLPNITAEEIWRAIRLRWIDNYIGSQDVVTHDAGKQFVAKVFQTNAQLLHIDIKCVPIESPNSMAYVERYHTQIHHAHKVLTSKALGLDAKAVL